MMRKTLIAACAAGLISVSAETTFLFVPAHAASKAPPQASEETYKYLDLFGSVFERVRRDYVEEVSDKQLVEAAINGMLTSLDPHSSYLDAKSYQDMQTQTRGEFGGLGIEMTMENGWVKVITPIDDTPAARAGLRPGDFITHLDGRPVLGLSMQEALDAMRGKPGSSITLSIRRDKTPPFDVSLTRAMIQIKSVRFRREGDIGYIRITSFSEKTYDEVKKGIETLRAEIGPGKLQGFVLDLRNNPGGLLEQAVAVSDAFLEGGEIVSTRSRYPEETQRYNARKGDLTQGLPLVAIINDGSASASEIVAGALQDHRRAIVVGTKSFGKGSVQTVIPLSSYGAMRLTTSRYYTPAGRSIQAVGIEPDIEIKQLKATELDSGYRWAEADLPHALANENADKASPALPPKGENAADASGEEMVQDYQLFRALDVLKGVSLYRQSLAKERR